MRSSGKQLEKVKVSQGMTSSLNSNISIKLNVNNKPLEALAKREVPKLNKLAEASYSWLRGLGASHLTLTIIIKNESFCLNIKSNCSKNRY